MEQRPLRLGDIVDDYCPRERRITNHAILAMIGADIQSTRCATCESEHPYKKARLPLRKVKDAAPAKPELVRPAAVAEPSAPAPEPSATPYEPPTPSFEPATEPHEPPPESPEPYHRPLIRAALPKGIVPNTPRPLPDFTMRSIRNRDGRDGRNGRRHFR